MSIPTPGLRVLFPILLALAARPAAQGSVLVVDDDGGPGVFQSVVKAVNNAQDGDVVLIKAGTYFPANPGTPNAEHVLIDGKSLTLVAEDGAQVLFEFELEVRIRNLDPNQWVAIRGIETRGGRWTLANNQGAVWIEDVTIRPPSVGAFMSLNLLSATNCASVALNRCEIFGEPIVPEFTPVSYTHLTLPTIYSV